MAFLLDKIKRKNGPQNGQKKAISEKQMAKEKERDEEKIQICAHRSTTTNCQNALRKKL